MKERPWETAQRQAKENADLAVATFQAGDLVDMSDFFGGVTSVALLLDSPRDPWPVEAIHWQEDLEATEPFEHAIPIDFLGKYGRLLWRAHH